MATGEFSGRDIFFEGGSAILVGDGILQGTGNASGDAIQCTGSGYLEVPPITKHSYTSELYLA